MKQTVIQTRALTKRFRRSNKTNQAASEIRRLIVAVDHVDLEIPPGTVFGLIGPNGAGKTTLVKLLSTLIAPDSGQAFINGYDVTKEPRKVASSIGLSLGNERSFYWRLTGRQNLSFFGAMNGLRGKHLGYNIDRILDLVELREHADVKFMEYSLGTKRKLDIARALMTDPPVLFLDEPTSSIDPRAAIKIRDIIHEAKHQGKTIVLVTHNLEEAERLADVIAVMDQGKFVAIGDAISVRGLCEGVRISVCLVNASSDHLIQDLTILEGVNRVTEHNRELTIFARQQGDVVTRIIRVVALAQVELKSVNVTRPSLEDAFLYLTGKNHDASGSSLHQARVP